eukprot:scaffold118005_cov74-Phaeocystis_antarctica.AAC.1
MTRCPHSARIGAPRSRTPRTTRSPCSPASAPRPSTRRALSESYFLRGVRARSVSRRARAVERGRAEGERRGAR